ncbi:MAG: DUF1016 N-terminal domain-containing protein [bacterium]
MTKQLMNTKRYEVLRDELTRILEKGRGQAVTAVSKILVQTYWEMGRRLSRERESLGRGEVTPFLERLGRDLEVGPTVVRDAWKFHKTYPEGLPKGRGYRSLSWGAHTALLPIVNPKAREFYLERAVEEGWSRPRLRKAIRADLYGTLTGAAVGGGGGGGWGEGGGGGSGRDSRSGGGKAVLPLLDSAARDLHNYVGVLERVIDGDTIEVRIDLGFDVWRVETIRLRGLDTPERGSAPGKRATKFVEKKLGAAPFVGLRTYKTDKYARYIADVFYHTAKASPAVTFDKGVFLNQELLDKGLASRVYMPV